MADTTKKKYTRDYYPFNPFPDLGPSTWVLDTIVEPIVVITDASTRRIPAGKR